MSFYGSSFIFDGVFSELYDLRIFDFNPSNPADSPAGGTASIKEEWLYRREAPYFYGRYYQEPLEFDFTVGSFNPIDGATRSAIQSWLIGRPAYLPLRIVQDDISDIVFNVIITKSTHIYVGNIAYGITLHAKCDRPWGVYIPPIVTKVYSGGLSTATFDYLNTSVYAGYNRPVITFTTDGAATYFSLINHSDDEREFRFDLLSPYETITIDNDKGIITTDKPNTLRMGNFNKKFFRLKQGINNITLSGYITLFTMSATFAKGIGV